MSSPQNEREQFESNDCQSLDCVAAKVKRLNKIKSNVKRIMDAGVPRSGKAANARLNAVKRFAKQAKKI